MLGTTRPESTAPADPHAPGPLDRPRPRIFLAVAVAVFSAVGSAAAGRGQTWATEPGLPGLLLLLVSPLALVVLLPRRPALASVLSVAATLTFLLLGFPWGPVFLGPVALLAGVMLSGAARRARLVAWSGAALLVGGVGAVAVLIAPRVERHLRDDPPAPVETWDPRGPGFHGRDWGGSGWGGNGWGGGDGTWLLNPGSLIAAAAWLAVVLLVASALRDRSTRRIVARAAARETAAERERTAVASERLRIARELHDVLAHSLSAINVQAGVGLHLLDKHPGQAREALTNIRDTSRDALTEVRAVLGIVREGTTRPPGTPPGTSAVPGIGTPPGPTAPGIGAPPDTRPEPDPDRDDAAPLTPTWDLGDLRRLADQARADGLDVALELAPDLGELPDHVAGVVHRVVQESLTNVRRHAPSARRVTVRLTRDDGLELVVTDDAVGSGEPADPGYGLLGMRERVEGAGGTLTAGPRSDAPGWQVRATLPVAGRPATADPRAAGRLPTADPRAAGRPRAAGQPRVDPAESRPASTSEPTADEDRPQAGPAEYPPETEEPT